MNKAYQIEVELPTDEPVSPAVAIAEASRYVAYGDHSDTFALHSSIVDVTVYHDADENPVAVAFDVMCQFDDEDDVEEFFDNMDQLYQVIDVEEISIVPVEE